ncbi:Transmembrane and coiled-coil domain-containing protein 4 [Phlyctochytrium planicorne]|nr:Transmembrane and coiled-coil domain-containing protein 4 [Phlyctochytrium planicorne]
MPLNTEVSTNLLHVIRLSLEEERKSLNFATTQLVSELDYNILDTFNLAFNRRSSSKSHSYCHASVNAYDGWRKQMLVNVSEYHGQKAADVELFGSELNLVMAFDLFKKSVGDAVSECSPAKTLDSVISIIASDILKSAIVQLTTKELRYDPRTRALLRRLLQYTQAQFPQHFLSRDLLANNFGDLNEVYSSILHTVEAKVAAELLSQVESSGQSEATVGSAEKGSVALAEADRQQKADVDKQFQKWLTIGLATVGSGVVLGVTGGLAAPFIGAGMGSLLAGLGVTGTAAMVGVVGSTAGAAVVGTLFGITGGGVAAFKFNRRLQGLEECLFKPVIPHNSSLHAIICISGWLETLDDATEPWTILEEFAPFSEVDAMVFDSHHLITLGTAIRDFLGSTAASYAATEVLKHTVLGGLMMALVWPVGLLQLGYLVDNPWSIGLDRSRKAGELLGRDVLLPQVQGKRPITLVGWGLGARAIFYALLELASAGENGNHNAYGIVDSVYLFGAPVEGSLEAWTRAASVVAGRFVNGYSKTDWFLYFLYRAGSPNDRVAGLHPMATLADAGVTASFGWNKPTTLQAADWKRSRIENFELSSIVANHASYKESIGDILEYVGFERITDAKAGRIISPTGSALNLSKTSLTSVGSLQSLAEEDHEEKRVQILNFLPRKSSLAPSGHMPQTAPVYQSSNRRKASIRLPTLDDQEVGREPRIELRKASLKPNSIAHHQHPKPPTLILPNHNETPSSVVTLFDSEVETGEKGTGDLGSDPSTCDPQDTLVDSAAFLESSVLLGPPSPMRRKGSPIQAVFEPNMLAVDPLSRGASSSSLGEDEADRKEADAWVGAGIDERVYFGPVAEMVGTPLAGASPKPF